MTLTGINFLAVIVSTLVYFVLGALWYSPLLFDKQFMRFRGATREQLMAEPPIKYLYALLSDLLSALVLAIIINLVKPAGVVDGIFVGVVMAVGLVASGTLKFSIFSIGPSKGLWAVFAGYVIVGFAVMGAILTLWR